MKAQFEKGLPGHGPVPTHMHAGHPTPWSEGTVVVFSNPSGDAWFANLQPGCGHVSKIVEWASAEAFVVIARGATYFVYPSISDSWLYLGDSVSECLVTPSGERAIIVTDTSIACIDTNGTTMWRRHSNIAIDGIEIQRLNDQVVAGEGCIDPPYSWKPFAIRLDDGVDF